MKKHKGCGEGVKRDEVRVVRDVPKSDFTIASVFGPSRTLTSQGPGSVVRNLLRLGQVGH